MVLSFSTRINSELGVEVIVTPAAHPVHPPHLPAVERRMKRVGYHDPTLLYARSPIYRLFRAISRQKHAILCQISMKKSGYNKTFPTLPSQCN